MCLFGGENFLGVGEGTVEDGRAVGVRHRGDVGVDNCGGGKLCGHVSTDARDFGGAGPGAVTSCAAGEVTKVVESDVRNVLWESSFGVEVGEYAVADAAVRDACECVFDA